MMPTGVLHSFVCIILFSECMALSIRLFGVSGAIFSFGTIANNAALNIFLYNSMYGGKLTSLLQLISEMPK